jgi:hypothetical protein
MKKTAAPMHPARQSNADMMIMPAFFAFELALQ